METTIMPPKSKTSKVKEEEVVEETPGVSEEVPKKAISEENSPDVVTTPSWRAEVVEEGAEEEKKEEMSGAPEEKGPAEEEKVTDLTGVGSTGSSETPKPSESSWVEENSTPPPPDNSVTISLSKKLFWLFLFLLIAGLVVGGFFYYRSRVGGEPGSGSSETPTSAPTAEATSTPTPAEEVKLDSLKVSILNGAGIPGEAGKVQALLEEAGFADFETGNADNYNYTVTEVRLKGGVSTKAFDAIKEALDEYNVVNQEEVLEEDSEFDLEIIVGTKEAASTPTPSQ